MNFLAHIYLSGSDPEVITGNFIADHIKGNQYLAFAPGIRKGVLLHRFIDHYTDTHEIVNETKARLRPKFRKYSPVIADVFYDHFLAAGWNSFGEPSLDLYAVEFYKKILEQQSILPDRSVRVIRHMVQGNWLLMYQTIEGTGTILEQMSTRAKFANKMNQAGDELQSNYSDYKIEFEAFFPELVHAASNKLNELNSEFERQ